MYRNLIIRKHNLVLGDDIGQTFKNHTDNAFLLKKKTTLALVT